ncbi:hypothetical protein B0F90DRAFT_4620 [Multifurca ochricompacta]|uniref:Uncharacterized protein n=1 Tax=Multifurca ochricompacta TaxID=376703 RepID=A0AAD4QSZ2_9AGAM|nr:hypothetical protein B0F90DRAFT_4620 [Multifurca ochricompacta]
MAIMDTCIIIACISVWPQFGSWCLLRYSATPRLLGINVDVAARKDDSETLRSVSRPVQRTFLRICQRSVYWTNDFLSLRSALTGPACATGARRTARLRHGSPHRYATATEPQSIILKSAGHPRLVDFGMVHMFICSVLWAVYAAEIPMDGSYTILRKLQVLPDTEQRVLHSLRIGCPVRLSM